MKVCAMSENHMKRNALSAAGFTMVELLVAMLISVIVLGTVYIAYKSQQATYVQQQSVVELQQNLRAATDLMVRELRLTGYDPEDSGKFGIRTMEDGLVWITRDSNDSGKITDDIDFSSIEDVEIVGFGFSQTDNVDSDNDGEPDDKSPAQLMILCNDTSAGHYTEIPIADNIQVVEFRYLDEDGDVTTDADDVQAIQISILARASRKDPDYTDTKTYETAGGNSYGSYDDHYRRRMLITTVELRNIGM